MALNITSLNQKYNYLLSLYNQLVGGLIPIPTSSNLAQVLTNGNSAGTNDIDMNFNDIQNTSEINFLDGVNSANLLFDPLAPANFEIVCSGDLELRPTGSIDCNGQTINMRDGRIIQLDDIESPVNVDLDIICKGTADLVVTTGAGMGTEKFRIADTGNWTTSGGLNYNNTTNVLTATTFSGNATSATNIAGGAGGSIPYQSASSTTALLANGTTGQVLTSQGTTLAPIWTTPSGGSSYPGNLTATTTTAGATSVDFYENGVHYRCWVFPTAGAYTLTISSYTPNAFVDFCIVGGGGNGGNGSANEGGGGGGAGCIIVGYYCSILGTSAVTGSVGGAGASSTIVFPQETFAGLSTTTYTANGGGNGGNGGVAGSNGTAGFTNTYTTPFNITLGSSGGGGGGGAGAPAGGTAPGPTNSFARTANSNTLWGGGRNGGNGSALNGGGAGGGGCNNVGPTSTNQFGQRGGRGVRLAFDNTSFGRVLACGGAGGAGPGGAGGPQAIPSGGSGSLGGGGGPGVNGSAGNIGGNGGGGGGVGATTGGAGGTGLVMIRYTIP